MSSPIHKYLFSPPPSPPRRPTDSPKLSVDLDATPIALTRSLSRSPGPASSRGSSTSIASPLPSNPRLSSIKALLLPNDIIVDSGALPLDGIAASPRTPQQQQHSGFTLDDAYTPSMYPKPRVYVEDVEAFPRTPPVLISEPATPRQRFYDSSKEKMSPASYPTNVSVTSATTTSSVPLPTLPRPLLRLLLLASLVISSIMMLVLVPSARLPSLRAASMSRRLALSTDGRAYLDLQNTVGSFEEARDRDYVPPKIRAAKMMKRGLVMEEVEVAVAVEGMTEGASTGSTADSLTHVPAHPKTARPVLLPRPLPTSHELIALQSYLLQSAYNTIPAFVDAAEPLDALSILGVGAHELGPSGGEREKAWFRELETEREDDVVIWYGGDGEKQQPHDLLDAISSIPNTKSHRHPILIPCHARADRLLLHAILSRHSMDFAHHPILMIGNQPIVASPEAIKDLQASGKLEEMLVKIGWVKREERDGREKRVPKKPKMAKWVKKEKSEVEEAMKKAQKKH